MGYYIKHLPNKKSAPKWKVQYISWKHEDTKSSKAKKPKREWDVPKVRWPALGFAESMNIAEARSRGHQMNAQDQLKRQEEQLLKIADQQNQFQLRYDSVLQ